ncbi:terminase small subunit [Ligilactobacillus ruminis]|uniref:terminase small subunit n=1 Tax=Ligilactobacillus ruminis TaxID=1623 RepID=UPI0022E2E9E9|nr:terminase small subunit [Ligilactobacillus ruminis]
MTEKKKKLTAKQSAFIDAYLGEAKMNATQAARIAGYKHPEAQGAENLRKLRPWIDEVMSKRHSNAIATQKEIQEFFTSVVRGEVKEEVVSSNGLVLEVPASTKDRLKAAECMGRAYGMFTERKEIIGTMDINIGVGDYDDD